MMIENQTNLENLNNQEDHSLVIELKEIIANLTNELQDKNNELKDNNNELKDKNLELKNKDFDLEFANLRIEELENNLQLSKNKFNKLKKLFQATNESLNQLKGEEINKSPEIELEKIENTTELAAKNPAKSSSLKKNLDQKCAHIKDKLNSIRCSCCEKLRENIVETLAEMQENTLNFHDQMVIAQLRAQDFERKNEKLEIVNAKLVEQMRIVISKAASKDVKIAAIRDFYEGQLKKWEQFNDRPKTRTAEADRVFAYETLTKQLEFVKQETGFLKKQFLSFMKNFNFAFDNGKIRDVFEMIESRRKNIIYYFEEFLEGMVELEEG